MRLRFTPRATADLIAIADFVRARNPASAGRVRDATLSSLQTLLSFPEIGRKQTVEGVRKLVTARFGYLIYCSVDPANDEIIILTIQHPARRREYTDT